MKIIFNQTASDPLSGLYRFGVQHCCLKQLQPARDQKNITKKVHHHTGFELHMITDGYQTYVVKGETCRIERGGFLLIYPNVPHQVIDSAEQTQKSALTFTFPLEETVRCVSGRMTDRILDTIAFLVKEKGQKKEFSSVLIENCILEVILSVFRLAGVKEESDSREETENAVLMLAKQFIEDNVDRALSVDDVSAYCYLSTKQLTRIFNAYEEVSPGAYIKMQRIRRIETLLADPSYTLKQISEMMQFSNEYYFNAFFKKHAGMPPGAYRKMVGKG